MDGVVPGGGRGTPRVPLATSARHCTLLYADERTDVGNE